MYCVVTMEHLPIFIQTKGRPCLVIGGGPVAIRKIGSLSRAGARVTVVCPKPTGELRAMAADDRIILCERHYRPEDLDGVILVVAATDDKGVNRRISRHCRDRALPVNIVDDPALCSFIMPSIIDRSPVIVAISTGGSAPVLARLLRARLETLIPPAYGRLAELMANFRDRVKDKIPDIGLRRRFWEQIVQGPVAEQLFEGKMSRAIRTLEQAISSKEIDRHRGGEVYLVGCGPGSPDLLTFRALRLMQQADVVVYDRLVSPEIVDLCRKDAKRIYVGKARDCHALPQDEINTLLVEMASAGHRVIRLKGGDPFIFGRGGEEIETLAAQGIAFQIVPGITAATGCAAYAGIPLTHREFAQSCIFTTGHLSDGSVNLNWAALIQSQQTIAIYMGLHGLAKICAGFVEHGMSPAMPAALIQQGTTSEQKVLTATVADLPTIAEREAVRPPCMVIIGEVVRLRDKLAWFEGGLAVDAPSTDV